MTELAADQLLGFLEDVELRLRVLLEDVQYYRERIRILENGEPPQDEPFDVLQARAIDRARSLLAKGETGTVLAALDKAGADRVSNLTETNIRVFLEAIDG